MASDRPAAIDGTTLQARVGTVVKGKWKLVRLVGVGGMAAVYEARHQIGRREAIKILHADVVGDEELVERFRREAHAANKLNHPSVVEVRDVDVTEDGLPFLVMELVEGESLARRLRRARVLPLDEALDLGDQLLDVLIAAHEGGIVHRDIKPSNLLIEDNRKLRVLDFGVARITHAPKPLTLAGTTLGTVGYMPPEQLKSGDVDARADVYAVGAILYEMLAGKPMFEAESEQELARMIARDPAPPLSDAASDVPEDVCMLVDRALAHLASRRYPDAATMREDLRAARGGNAPPYAAARLAAGDDPRNLEPPKEEQRERVTAPITAIEVTQETPTRRVPQTIVEDEPVTKVSPTLIDDDASTKRHAVEEEPVIEAETPTVPQVRGGTIKMEAAEPVATVASTAVDAPPPAPETPAAPSYVPSRITPGGVTMLGWVAAGVAALALLVIFLGVGDDEETTVPVNEPPVTSASAPATLEPRPPPAPQPVPIAPEDSANPSPDPRREADGGLPFTLPSGLPSTFPTAIPTSLPSGFPTGLPPMPAPSAAPRP